LVSDVESGKVKFDRTPFEPILSPEEQVMGAIGAPSEGGLASIARAGAPKPPSELAPGEEFGKGLGAGVIGLKSMWESAGLMKDIGAMSTVQQRQDLFNKIETGQITSPDQLRGLDETTSQARAYLMSDPATREKLRERNVGEIGRRTDFVKAALTTVDQYQKDAQKYKGRTTDLTDIEGAKDFANWLSYNVGSGAVQLAPIMIAAATTGGAGVAALGIGMGTGEAIGNRLQFLEKRIKDLPPEQKAAEVIDYIKKTGDTSLAVGVVSGALDAVLGPAATLAKRGLGEVVKGETRKEALKAGVKEIPKGMGQEFITGGAQEATQLGGALAEREIDEFLTKENAKKILNAAAAEAAGAIGGGAATTAARVYGADQAIRAKEKQDAQRQELEAKMSELDELLKTVYPQEPPPAATEPPAPPVAPVAPEGGIAGLMPEAPPPAPQAPPAAIVEDEEAPAQDMEAMLREALGATESDINTVNVGKPLVPTEAPVAELDQSQVTAMTDEQLKAQINNINLRDREYELVKAELDSRQAQPPSTKLVEEVIPEAPVAKTRPSTPEIYNAIIDGWQGNANKLPKETLTWMTESGLIKDGSTTPLGQRLMDTVKQAEEAYKSSQGVDILEATQRGEPMPIRKSMSMDQVDEVVDKFLAANKPKIAPKPVVTPAAPAAPAVNPKVQEFLELENQSRENRKQKPLTYEQALKLINEDVENDMEFGDFDTSAKRMVEEARGRLERDAEVTSPESTINISKTGEALRNKPFVPDELDKKAIEIYKKIKAANPDADIDQEIQNPNVQHSIEEQANSKGIKIGDLVYMKGDPSPRIAISVSKDRVKLLDQDTGNGGFSEIENVSKEPIDYDFGFDFGYGEINVNVDRWLNYDNQWQFSMYGPGASGTGFRSALGVRFDGKPGTKEFKDFVERVVRSNTADRPLEIAKEKAQAEKNLTPAERKKRRDEEAKADKERLEKEAAESDERIKASNELKAEILAHMKKNKIGIYSPMPSLATAMETIEKIKKGNKTDVRAEGWMKGQGIIWTPNKKPQFTRMGNRFVQEVYKRAQKLTDEQRASGSEDASILQAAVDKANAISNKERDKALADKQKALEAQGVDKAKLEAAKADIEDALSDLSMLITKGTRLNIMPEDEQKLMPILTRLMDGAFRAGYYKFKEAARYVMGLIRAKLGNDFADEINIDQLQGAYIGMAGKYQDQGASSKKEVIAIESMEEIDDVAEEAVAEEAVEEATEEAGGMDINRASDRFEVAQNISDFFLNNGDFRDITQARKMISKMTGQEIKPGTRESKMADEAIEAGVVMAARSIVDTGRKDELTAAEIYDQLVDLYDRQPNLSSRSSTSVSEQAYSTPAPLAFIASELAGIDNSTVVYEPTAGNGMLLIGASEDNIIANELNADRFEMLSRILEGSEIGNENALSSNVKGADFDVVIENPPFGKAGNISDIDHAIAMHSLEGMKDDGKAVLILGGVQANTEEGRREGYRGKAKREFYYNLYNKYNVVDHFTAGGNMYAKQGTTYPVDVIVIDGVGKSKRDLPAADLPQVITSYEQLKEKLNDRMVSTGDGSAAGVDSGKGAQGRPTAPGLGERAGRPSDVAGTEGGRPAGGGKPSVSEAGTAGGGQREPSGGVTGDGKPRPTDESKRGPAEKPVSGKGEGGKPAGQGGAGERQPSGVGGVGLVSGERLGSSLEKRADQEQETAGQATYEPESKANAVGTLAPRAMYQSIKESLDKIKSEVGDIDEYVAESLEMDVDDLRDSFSAEQVDALAMSIRNAEEGKGFIIGDQTGVGKGRVVAAMIKYALINGKIPIFVTERPNLFADMIRDLDDIGMTQELGLDTARPKILMTNADEKVPYELSRTVRGEVVTTELTLRAPASKSAKVAELMKGMIEKNDLGHYKIIFTTYHQMQSKKGKEVERQRFIRHFGAGNYMIFDESHNAGGSGGGRKSGEEQQEIKGRAGFIRNLVKNAGGTFFSSATYAKRPDVMDLYSSTDMKLAVKSISELAEAIKSGGIPMQQTVANMLTKAGQYIRRERTFAGVSYDTQLTKVDKQTAENMAESMREILKFSRAKEVVVKDMQKDLDRKGGKVSVAGEKTQIQSANFGSIMHNLIDQMLLSLKAQDSVNHAIERLKAGEKVVMTVSNTMGSFLQSYADEMGINVGDPMNLSFSDLYMRYLEKQRVIKIKKPDGTVEEYRLTDEDLGPELVDQYASIRDFVENAGFGSAPISPIDYMHNELRKAGFKTDEITGRTVTLNYSTGKPLLASRSSKTSDRIKAVKGFNNGSIDVLILNQAGSTGLSLHANKKFIDQRKRHMIIVQAEKNIDTHMQMLGRVHRTGQVIPPAYSQMMADIPAEMRPAANLLKKMASLNANTTASRKSAVTAEGAVDFMNDYGGQVMQEYLRDNPEVYEQLGGKAVIDIMEDPSEADEDDIRKVSGYIPILPIKVQEEVYKDIVDRYNDLVEREDSMGTNKLEAKAEDLDAITLSSKPITEAKDDPSVFAQPAFMERVDVKRRVKPYSKQEVQEQVKERLDKAGMTASQLSKDLFQKIFDKYKAYGTEKVADAVAAGADNAKVETIRNQLNSQYLQVKTILDNYPVGSPVQVKNKKGALFNGVVTDLQNKGRTKNPVAGSDWKMTIALADGEDKSTSLSFSQIGGVYEISERRDVNWLNPDTMQGEWMPMLDLFDKGATVRREKRWMVTGNILAGFAEVNNMGQIISYTKDDGTTGQGILMPRTFDFEKEQKNAPVKLKNMAEIDKFFTEFGRNAVISTTDGLLKIRNDGNGRFTYTTPSSKRQGGTYFLDKGLTQFTGDFYKNGSLMVATVYDEIKSDKAIKYLMQERQEVLIAFNNKDKAREMFAPKEPFVAPLANVPKLPPGRSPELTMAAQLVQSGEMTKEEYDALVNFYKPIKPLEKPLAPATEEQVYDALDKVKREKVDPEIMPGVEVGLRLDIPAFNRKGVYVVSIHSKGTKSGPGRVLGYSNVAKVRDVTFGLGNERSALKIAGGAAKDALQTIEGKYVETTAEKAFEEAQAAFNDPQWVQIGIDPTRHSYFYDKNTTQPVVAAEEVIQIGNMVLGKNVSYGTKDDFLFSPGLETAVNAYTDRDAMIEQYARLRQKRAYITEKFAKGQAGLTEQQMINEIDSVTKALKADIDASKPKRTTAGNFFADATKAWDAGIISDDVYDVIDRLYKKFPEILEGLSFSVTKQPKDSIAAGQFFALSRIVRLYKGTVGTSDPSTIRHEIAHSLEQMMSIEATNKLVDEWDAAVKKAIKEEKSKAGIAFFEEMMNFMGAPSQQSYDAMIRALPNMDYYQYVNPSEFWAVNAEPLMARKLGSGWDKFVLMSKRLFEGLKYIFGFDNKYIVHKVFNDIMNAKGERIRKAVLADYVSRISMPLNNMVKNYKGGPGALATWETAPESTLRDFRYRVVDKHTDMRMVVKQIEDQIDSLQDEHDPSLQEDLYHSSKSTKTEDFIKEEMRPFIKKMDEMGVSMGEFEAFLHARHASVRNKLIADRGGLADGGSGMFDDEVKEFFDDLNKHPEKKKQFEELAKTIDGWVEGTQDLLVSYGLETPETVAAWREKLPNYVPLKRDPDELDYVNPSSGLGQGFGVRGSFTKLAAGSYKTVVDIVNNVALQREAAIIRGEKAKVGRALYALAIQNPNPNFWKVVNPDAIRNKKKLKEEMEGFGLTIEQANAIFAEPRTAMIDETTGLIRYRVNPALRNSPNVFPVRINGKDRYVFFNAGNPSAKRMAEALKNMDANQLSDAMGRAAEVTRLIAAMNTQYNPVFGAWNFARDVVGGSINLSSTELKDQKMKVMAGSIPALRAIFTDLRGMKPSLFGITANPKQQEWIDLWQQFRDVGGITGYSEQFSRSKDKATLVQRELARLDHGTIRKAVDAVLDWLSDYNDAMENAVRLSAYKAGLDAGMTSQRAAALAKNLTVNFNRKGQATANANALYAFFNARVQGTARMMEVMYDEKDGKISMTGVGKKIIAGGMLIGAFQAIALMAAGFDGDEPPDFLKSKNIIIPTGNGTYAIIPMPLGWNLFPNIGREVTEYVLINAGAMKGRRALTTTMTNIMAQVIDMFNPLGAGSPANFFAPTIADPIVSLAVNKDAFGRPISREGRETTPTPGWERSRDTATALSKALAYGINYITGGGEDGIGAVSPTADQLDYIAREYAGGVGREITKAVRYVANKATGEEIPAYSVPIAGKLYGELDSPSAVADKFYKNVKAMAEHEGAIKRIKERKGDVNDYRKENKEATVRLINRANYVENEVAKYNREIRALVKKEAPEKDIKFKKEKRDALMKAYNEEVRRVQ
jgi:hypothetical protein